MRKITRWTCVMLLCIMASSSLRATLNGNYTINSGAAASASNYQTVSAAVSDMVLGTRADGGPSNGPGVSGPVTLRIAAGTGPYNEQISISAIPGASLANTVRITGGPTRATVQFTGTTTTDRHVFRLNGCKNVTLDSLTIINNDPTYGYGVWLTANADSNKVLNSIITVNATATTANFAGITLSAATPSTAGNNGDFNLIQGNTINGGYYGISNNGTGTTVLSQGNHILNNTIRDYYFYGIRNYYQSGGNIIGNTVYARASATVSNYGMYLYYNDRFSVSKNLIYNTGTYGIYLFYANWQGGTIGSRATVSNNMIGANITGSTTPYGIYVSTNTTNVDFFHNSVNLTSGNGRAMYLTGGTGNDIRNNIFSVTGSTTGYAFYCGTVSYASAINYNDYWAPGSSNFVYIAANYTPGTYVGGAGYNANSINLDPLFVGPTNLHINSNPSLYDAGANVGVTEDYDGQVRPLLPSVGYDIGADEFNVSANDAGVYALTSPLQPFGAGVQNVDFTIKNFGVSNLTATTVNWRVNGVAQAPYAWTGNLPTSGVSTPFTAGTYNFASGTTYSIKAWTTSPNGTADANNSNDTLTTNVCTGMSGTFTIGASGNFPTLNAAVAALQCGGVSGPVTFNLIQGAGPFNEQVIIPAIPGASAVNTIRFNGGATRETVQFTGTTTAEKAVIKLNGADHIILDSLTVINNDPTNGFGIHLTNNADSNKVRNCVVNVLANSTSANFAGIVIAGLTAITAGDNGDGNLIQGNAVDGGYYGITQYGVGTTTFSQNNHIIGNTVTNVYYYGIQSYYQNLSIVNRNVVRHRPSGSTTGYAIYLNYNDRFELNQNRILAGGSYGLYIAYGNYQGGASTGRASVVNNMVGGSWLGTSPYGIYLSTNCTGLDILHNSVSITSGNGRCIYIISGVANSVRNNSFSYTGSTTGYAAYVTQTTYVTAMDYNNYYCPGSANFVYVGTPFSTTTYVGGAGFNLNSRDGDPFYINPLSDLHAEATQLFDHGDPTVGVTTDYDDEARPNPFSTIPDIGADEYIPDTVNAGFASLLEPSNFNCPDSFQVVKVVLFNKGINTISNIPITANFTGAITASLSFVHPGPMPLGDRDTVTIGTINTWSGGTIQAEIYHSLANDQKHADDTLRVTRLINTTPVAPTASGNLQLCEGDSTELVAVATGTNYWYDAHQGGNLLVSGDTLRTGPLATSTTYFVESRGLSTTSLATTFAAGNGCGGGAMFDVTGLRTVTIDSFDTGVSVTGAVQVDVYYKVGSYAGFETTPGAWTLLGSATVTGLGIGQPTRVPVGGLTIPNGQTYGIYIASTGASYTTLASTYTSPELSITTGVGLCSLFGGTNQGRTWNGRLYYLAEGCPSQRSAVTVNVTPTPTVSIADSSNCGPITLDAGNPGLTYAWSNGPTTQTMTATTSGIYTVTVSDGNCAASDSANVTIESIPTVSLPPDSLLCNGASMTLDAGNQAGAAILWSTGDTSQTISANTAGTYWVNVSTAAGCQGSDSITVSTLLAPVGSITSNLGGCPTIAFTGSNAGGGAANGTWDFGDGGTASGVNPSHTYTANGSYTVTYSQSNACGADVATTTITVNCITGVSNPSQVDIALFPNPTAGAVSMELNLPSANEGMVTVMDLHGRMVIQKAASLVAGRNRVDLDLSKMSAGVYLVRLSADGLHWQGKVVKE